VIFIFIRLIKYVIFLCCSCIYRLMSIHLFTHQFYFMPSEHWSWKCSITAVSHLFMHIMGSFVNICIIRTKCTFMSFTMYRKGRMKWCLRQRQKSMLHQTLHVRVASDTQKIQSTDWLKWCALWRYVISHCYQSKRHFRWSHKWVVDTSVLRYGMAVESSLWPNYHKCYVAGTGVELVSPVLAFPSLLLNFGSTKSPQI